MINFFYFITHSFFSKILAKSPSFLDFQQNLTNSISNSLQLTSTYNIITISFISHSPPGCHISFKAEHFTSSCSASEWSIRQQPTPGLTHYESCYMMTLLSHGLCGLLQLNSCITYLLI